MTESIVTSSSAGERRATTEKKSNQPSNRKSLGFKGLSDRFHLVKEQTVNGMRVVKRIRAFFSKYCKLHETFSNELTKITAYERDKLKSMSAPDKMATCWVAWMSFFDKMDEVARAHMTLSLDSAQAAEQPLLAFYSVGKDTLVEVDRQANKTIDWLQHLKESIEYQKLQCLRRLEHLDKIKRKDASGKQIHKARVKAIHACEQYELELTKARAEYPERCNLEPVLGTLQHLEEHRLSTLGCALKEHAKSQKNYIDSVTECSDLFKVLQTSIVPEKDIHTFAQNLSNRSTHPSIFSQKLEYDIKYTAADLRKQAAILEKKNNNGSSENAEEKKLFGNTLEGMMLFEEKLGIADGVGVPVVLDTLIEAIRTTGTGFAAQGLFRIAAATEEKSALSTQLEQGNYLINYDNPHAPAGVLKALLRGLAEPLIPDHLYDECIKLGKLDHKEVSEGNFDNSIRSIIEQVPVLNINAIFRIVDLIKEVSCLEKVNKMTVENLGIVFAPSFLRPADMSDPMKYMSETSTARKFVSHVVNWISDWNTSKNSIPQLPKRMPPLPPNGTILPKSLAKTHIRKLKKWNTGTQKFPIPPPKRILENGIPKSRRSKNPSLELNSVPINTIQNIRDDNTDLISPKSINVEGFGCNSPPSSVKTSKMRKGLPKIKHHSSKSPSFRGGDSTARSLSLRRGESLYGLYKTAKTATKKAANILPTIMDQETESRFPKLSRSGSQSDTDKTSMRKRKDTSKRSGSFLPSLDVPESETSITGRIHRSDSSESTRKIQLQHQRSQSAPTTTSITTISNSNVVDKYPFGKFSPNKNAQKTSQIALSNPKQERLSPCSKKLLHNSFSHFNNNNENGDSSDDDSYVPSYPSDKSTGEICNSTFDGGGDSKDREKVCDKCDKKGTTTRKSIESDANSHDCTSYEQSVRDRSDSCISCGRISDFGEKFLVRKKGTLALS